MQTDVITNRNLKHLSDIKPGGLFTFGTGTAAFMKCDGKAFNDGFAYVNTGNGEVFTTEVDVDVLPLYQTRTIMLSVFDPEAV